MKAAATPAVGGVDMAVDGVEAVATVAVGGVEAMATVAVDGVDAAAAAVLKKREAMDRKNALTNARRAAARLAAAALAGNVPSSGEDVDAGVKQKMDEVGPLPSKRQKAAEKHAEKLSLWFAENVGRGRAKPAGPARMRTCTRYLGHARTPTKIVMRPGGGGRSALRTVRSFNCRRV